MEKETILKAMDEIGIGYCSPEACARDEMGIGVTWEEILQTDIDDLIDMYTHFRGSGV